MTSLTLAETFDRAPRRENECLCVVQVNSPSQLSDEAPADQSRAARGAITGMLLGAGMWAAIFLFVVAVFKH